MMFCFVPAALAESGYVGKLDLNGDGIDDLIESGPSYMFGTGGGPYSISIMDKDGNRTKQYLIGGHHRFAVERVGKTTTIWAYWHLSVDSGTLMSHSFTGDQYKKETIDIKSKNTSTRATRKIIQAIFTDENLLPMKKIENGYQVPPNPSGLEWGK